MAVIIPERLYSMFQTAGQMKKLPPKTNVFMQGDPAENLYLLVSGRVRVYTLSAEGEERTHEILEAGRIFGDSSFLTGIERRVSIESIVESKVVICDAETLIRLCHQSEELMVLVFQHMTETCNYLIHQVNRLAYYDRYQKIADFLLCEADHRGTQSLPYTHEELADSVSLNRVTVSRVLTEFRKKGWIDSGYGSICILDRQALEELLPE